MWSVIKTYIHIYIYILYVIYVIYPPIHTYMCYVYIYIYVIYVCTFVLVSVLAHIAQSQMLLNCRLALLPLSMSGRISGAKWSSAPLAKMFKYIIMYSSNALQTVIISHTCMYGCMWYLLVRYGIIRQFSYISWYLSC